MNQHIELLQAMPLFGGISEDAVKFLLEQSKTVSKPEGAFFFREDDEAFAMYVLEEGRAAVVKHSAGHRHLLSRLGRGDCFGEMSLMDMRRRSASVVAERACRAIELSSASLYWLYERDLEQFTMIQMNMAREVCRRLRDADEQLFQAKVAGVDTNYGFLTS